LKSCCVLQDHFDDERDKTVFTIQHQQTCKTQDQDRLLVSDRSCPKTDGLRVRSHHCLRWHIRDLNTGIFITARDTVNLYIIALAYLLKKWNWPRSRSLWNMEFCLCRYSWSI